MTKPDKLDEILDKYIVCKIGAELVDDMPVATVSLKRDYHEQIKQAIKAYIADEVREILGVITPITRGKTQSTDNPMYWTRHTKAQMELLTEQKKRAKANLTNKGEK